MNFRYEIANMDVVGEEAIVLRLHYRVSAQKEDCDVIPVRSGVIELDAPGEDLIPFEEITKDTALGWLKEKLDCDGIEASLTQEVNAIGLEQAQETLSKMPSSWVTEEAQ